MDSIQLFKLDYFWTDLLLTIHAVLAIGAPIVASVVPAFLTITTIRVVDVVTVITVALAVAVAVAPWRGC